MATDRADLAVVKRIVYDNLGVTNQSSGYGNLQTNERYLTGYIDDAIATADINTMKLLLKQKQFHLIGDYWSTLAIPNGYRMTLPENDAILGVYYYTSTAGADDKAVEVSKPVFDMIVAGGAFDVTNYKGYYTVQDGEIQLFGDKTYNSGNSYTFEISVLPSTFRTTTTNSLTNNQRVRLSSTGVLPAPFYENQDYYVRNPSASEFFELSETSGGTSIIITSGDDTGVHTIQVYDQSIGYIKYIKLTHESTLSSLYSPENFESCLANLASAILLMKRGDQPGQAQFYLGMYNQQMQSYMSPITDLQQMVERI